MEILTGGNACFKGDGEQRSQGSWREDTWLMVVTQGCAMTPKELMFLLVTHVFIVSLNEYLIGRLLPDTLLSANI